MAGGFVGPVRRMGTSIPSPPAGRMAQNRETGPPAELDGHVRQTSTLLPRNRRRRRGLSHGPPWHPRKPHHRPRRLASSPRPSPRPRNPTQHPGHPRLGPRHRMQMPPPTRFHRTLHQWLSRPPNLLPRLVTHSKKIVPLPSYGNVNGEKEYQAPEPE